MCVSVCVCVCERERERERERDALNRLILRDSFKFSSVLHSLDEDPNCGLWHLGWASSGYVCNHALPPPHASVS